MTWRSAKASLPSAKVGTGQIKFFFCFFLPNFFWGLATVIKTPFQNLGQFWVFLLYFFNYFCFVEFFWLFQIWTACTWNNGIWSFKKWYSWCLAYVEAVSRNSHEITSILLSKHGDVLAVKVYLNYIKFKRSPKIMKLVEVSCYRMWRPW